MAFSPTKASFYGNVGNFKVRVWLSPSFASGDTIAVPGIKVPFGAISAKTGVVSFTSTLNSNGWAVLTLTVSASSTGSNVPFTVFGY